MSSQSGALGIAILDYASQANIGISQFVSVGNKADVSGNDLLLAWEDDPSTDVILLYLESFGNPRKFSRIARRIGMSKPIIAVKSGRIEVGQHGGHEPHRGIGEFRCRRRCSLRAGRSDPDRTRSKRCSRWHRLLANQPLPRGRRVGIVTNAGGPGILAADALEAAGLILPELSEATRKRLSEKLPPEASTRNPVDTIASGGPDEYAHCLGVLIDSDEVDAVMVIYVPTTLERSRRRGRGYSDAQRSPTQRTSRSWRSSCNRERRRFWPVGRGPFPPSDFRRPALSPCRGPSDTANGARVIPESSGPLPTWTPPGSGEWWNRPLSRLGEEGGWLETDEVEVAPGGRRPGSAAQSAGDRRRERSGGRGRDRWSGGAQGDRSIGSPQVRRRRCPPQPRRSRGRGRGISDGFGTAVPDPQGVLVQEMVGGGHEVLIGMTEDANFGPLIVFGMGGVLVELLDDVAFRIHPLTDTEARSMILSIRTSRLLQGYRNLPLGDLDALEEALLRVSALINLVPEMVELDLNPVKVLAPGEGVRPVDARIRVKRLQPERSPELADLPSAHRRRRS